MKNDESRKAMDELAASWQKQREKEAEERASGLQMKGEKVSEEKEGWGELDQSRGAVWIAVGIIFLVNIANIVFSILARETPHAEVFGTNVSLIVPIAIDLFLGINLLRGKQWARKWMLVRVVLGLVVWGIITIIEKDFGGLVMQAGFCGAIIILLTGISARNRILGGIACFVLLVGGGIGWAAISPPTAVVTEKETETEILTTTEFKTFSKYGFSFEYPRGCSIAEYGVLQSEANDVSGIVQATKGLYDAYQVVWVAASQSLWEASGDLQQSIEDGFSGMEETEGIAHLDKGKLVEITKAGHETLYQYYIVTSTEGDKSCGVAGVFYCDKSEKVFSLMTAHPAISSEQDILEDFQRYLDSFVCH